MGVLVLPNGILPKSLLLGFTGRSLTPAFAKMSRTVLLGLLSCLPTSATESLFYITPYIFQKTLVLVTLKS